MDSNYKKLISVPIECSIDNYWKAIEIFLFNPRVTSKNIAGVVLDAFPVLQFGNALNLHSIECLTRTQDPNSVITSLQTSMDYQKEVTLDELRHKLNHSKGQEHLVWIVKILYKNIKYRPFSHKCYLIDFQRHSLTVLPLRSPSVDDPVELPYQITYSGNQLTISTDQTVKLPTRDKTIEWLKNVLLPRLQKWMQQVLISNSSEKSLKLVDCEEYNNLYNSLKIKYGKKMIEVWPEVTDPSKFVYEDVAIASYLLLIWKQERETSGCTKLQSFVDLGCGNGLLVYILAMEGHKGFGIDLRKRTIWDLYPKEVDLRVETIIPSDENLYPKTDWIIGNHSDELSPWVPVIAARSSSHCRFFLLPCCAFDFNGQKFQRRNSKLSQYLDFMEYAKEISLVCGYSVEMDRLKIPSTKRICLIGYDRTGSGSDLGKCSKEISEFIRRSSSSGETSMWSADFKPRETVELVKNCTKLKKSLVSDIVDLVFKEIVKEEFCDAEVFDGKWNIGRGVALGDLAKRLGKEQLTELKSECGGLQTLLRNNHHVFEVKGGTVQLRVPESIDQKKKRLLADGKSKLGQELKLQQKPCYYFTNHPNGCPLDKESCTFKHED